LHPYLVGLDLRDTEDVLDEPGQTLCVDAGDLECSLCLTWPVLEGAVASVQWSPATWSGWSSSSMAALRLARESAIRERPSTQNRI